MKKNISSIIKALSKINRFLNRVENFSKQNYVIVALKAIAAIVLLSMAIGLVFVFGGIAFVDDGNLELIPQKNTYGLDTVLTLLLIFWLFQLSVLLTQSLVLYGINKITGKWKWKGYWHTWNQIAVLPFLTIFVVAMFFVMGISFGSLSSPTTYSNGSIYSISRLLNENDTLIFFTAKLSAIIFVIMYFTSLLKFKIFSGLNNWKEL